MWPATLSSHLDPSSWQAKAEKRAAEVEAQRERGDRGRRTSFTEDHIQQSNDTFAGRVPPLSDRQLGTAAGSGPQTPGIIAGDKTPSPLSMPPPRAAPHALARARERRSSGEGHTPTRVPDTP